MQAHDFHQQLIAVGGTVKGTGTGTMIRLHFSFEQLLAANFTLCEQLPDAGFLTVGHARRHGTGRDENDG